MPRLHIRLASPEGELLVGGLTSARGRIYFQYDQGFRDRGIELSPYRLPTANGGVIEGPSAAELTDGLHGLFSDSLPDGWGLIVMNRALAHGGVEPRDITPLDRLAYLGPRAMGALIYAPSTNDDAHDRLQVDLASIADQAQRIYEGSAEEILPAILQAGGSPAGARPKVLAGVNAESELIVTRDDDLPPGFDHWIIKFFMPNTANDAGAAEMAYAEMARRAGITFPSTRLFTASDGRRFFGARRFDRVGRGPGDRRHVHTLAGLLNTSHRVHSLDYRDLLRVTTTLTRHQADAEEQFRRMVFNVLAHNRDDHAKNHAFILNEGYEWRIAPAYDLTFMHGPGGEHSLMVDGEGRTPTRRHVDTLAAFAGISPATAGGIVERVADAVSEWDVIARSLELKTRTRRDVQKTMNAVLAAFGPTARSRPNRRPV